jgi:hypothetical protein
MYHNSILRHHISSFPQSGSTSPGYYLLCPVAGASSLQMFVEEFCNDGADFNATLMAAESVRKW